MDSRIKARHIRIIFFIVVLAFLGVGYAANLRLSFPQIVIGDGCTTVIDLTNQGADTFRGDMAVLGNDGRYLSARVNDVATGGRDVAIVLAPGTVKRFVLSSDRGLANGHIAISDRETAATVKPQAFVSGTLFYNIRKNGVLTDAIGLEASLPQEEFEFLAEYGDKINTGLAVADPLSTQGGVTLELEAYSDSGNWVDGRIVKIPPGGHSAFLINEKLNLPKGFRGVVKGKASAALATVSLRLNGTQLSTVPVSASTAVFMADIAFSDSQHYLAELLLRLEGGILIGMMKFINPLPDKGWEFSPVTGYGNSGKIVGHFITSLWGSPVVAIFISEDFSVRTPGFAASLVWQTAGGDYNATLNAHKLN